ncbi:MAG: hypothetical protein KBD16_01940 [Candidatus Pacebacteria bacterium]|nr:hypothetical protein [Candidatus Paceibacterota bacterium]
MTFYVLLATLCSLVGTEVIFSIRRSMSLTVLENDLSEAASFTIIDTTPQS